VMQRHNSNLWKKLVWVHLFWLNKNVIFATCWRHKGAKA
jgi:hypothetical protein